jgi:phosphate uptake regulator
MENELTRAQHYRHLAESMRQSAREESAAKRQRDFLDLASQYERLADKLVGRQMPLPNGL